MGQNAIYLKKGQLVGGPASDEKTVYIDTDDVLKTIDSAGVKLPGGLPNFMRTALKTPLLTDADATIDPAADKCSLYIMPAGVMTAPRTLTFTNAGQTNTRYVRILRLDQSVHDLTIRNSTPTNLYTGTGTPGGALNMYWIYMTAGAWVQSAVDYMQLT